MDKRVLTKVENRKINRRIAKKNMLDAGMTKICKHSYTQGLTINGKKGQIFVSPSYFAEHWREYIY
jgi:hypothetical protein